MDNVVRSVDMCTQVPAVWNILTSVKHVTSLNGLKANEVGENRPHTLNVQYLYHRAEGNKSELQSL